MLVLNREERWRPRKTRGRFHFLGSSVPVKNKRKETAPQSCRKCEHWLEMREKLRVSELLTKAVERIEAQLKGKSLKPSLGDYLKLLQLEKELADGEGPKEIKVTWVDPAAESKTEK